MAEQSKRFIVEVEKARDGTEGRPSMGPVYRSLFTQDPLPRPIQGLHTCWDVFRFHPHSHLPIYSSLLILFFLYSHDTNVH